MGDKPRDPPASSQGAHRVRLSLTIMQTAELIEFFVNRGLTNEQICLLLDVHIEFVRSVKSRMRRREKLYVLGCKK